MPKIPERQRILIAAIQHVCGERDLEYGPPIEAHARIAGMWSAYLRGKHGADFAISAEDVAWLNVLQKMVRTMNGATAGDTYEDAAGYAAIAGEVRQDGEA